MGIGGHMSRSSVNDEDGRKDFGGGVKWRRLKEKGQRAKRVAGCEARV